MRASFVFAIIFSMSSTVAAAPSDFALRLCSTRPDIYKCVRIRIPRTARIQYKEWRDMFPDARERRLAMAINRRNTLLWNGHAVAMPHSWLDKRVVPEFRIGFTSFQKFVMVDLNILAWSAWEPTTDGKGRMVAWGPANGGRKICQEDGRLRCKTHPGVWPILKKYGRDKRSELYPVDCADKAACGHRMPYYMQIHPDGTGLHGDKWLVGRNASHGCVRMLAEDAKWLNGWAPVGTMVYVADY